MKKQFLFHFKKMADLVLLIDASYSVKQFVPDYTHCIQQLLFHYNEVSPDSRVTIGIFADSFMFLCMGKPLRSIKKFEYKVGTGITTLYDSIAYCINCAKHYHANRKTLFVTVTDGNDNGSKYHNVDSINKIVSELKDYWRFAYLGTDGEQCSIGVEMGFDFNIIYSQSNTSIERGFKEVYNILTNSKLPIKDDVSDYLCASMEGMVLKNE